MRRELFLQSKVIERILDKRGVCLEDLEPFKDVPEYDFINQKEGVRQYIGNMVENKSVGVLYDVDVDGLSSGKIMEEYTKRFGVKVERYMNTGKRHGLTEDVMEWVYKRGIEYLIVVDAGSADIEYYDRLNRDGVDVLVLDHHDIEKRLLKVRDGLVIVNCNYDGSANRGLSGAGVVYRFIRSVDKEVGFGGVDGSKRWVGLSVLSDYCPILNRENRHYVDYLYKNYEKDLLFSLFKNYGSLEGMFNFAVIPLLNACVRMGETELAMRLVTVNSEKKLKELIAEGEKVRERQKELVQSLEGEVSVLEGKSAVVGSVKGIKGYREVFGLLAGRYRNKMRKACMILERSGEGYEGSFRGMDGFDADELRGMGIRACGHKKACGVFIKRDDFKRAVRSFLEFQAEGQGGSLWELEFDFKDYMDYYKDLHRIAILNEITGNGFERIYVKINNLMGPREVLDYGKVRRTNYIGFSVVDFGMDKEYREDDELVAYPCLSGDSFVLVKAAEDEWV